MLTIGVEANPHIYVASQRIRGILPGLVRSFELCRLASPCVETTPAYYSSERARCGERRRQLSFFHFRNFCDCSAKGTKQELLLFFVARSGVASFSRRLATALPALPYLSDWHCSNAACLL